MVRTWLAFKWQCPRCYQLVQPRQAGCSHCGCSTADFVRDHPKIIGFRFPYPISESIPTAATQPVQTRCAGLLADGALAPGLAALHAAPRLSHFQRQAKLSARMAQTLSTTHVGEVKHDMKWLIEEVPDIVGPARGTSTGRVFSDGCSPISPTAMAELRQANEKNMIGFKDGPISAVQFRFQGSKGMMAVDPRLQHRPNSKCEKCGKRTAKNLGEPGQQEGRFLHRCNDGLCRHKFECVPITGVMTIRPSQKKFDADITKFEVNELATWKPAHLHRSLVRPQPVRTAPFRRASAASGAALSARAHRPSGQVRILSDRGVPFEVFKELQQQMTSSLDLMLQPSREGVECAKRMLRRLDRGASDSAPAPPPCHAGARA